MILDPSRSSIPFLSSALWASALASLYHLSFTPTSLICEATSNPCTIWRAESSPGRWGVKM